MPDKTHQVVVLDMQPIDPPIGGGRLRLLGLYHNLGKQFSTHYIGSYDWPGEKFRDHQLSATLWEVDIPLSPEHFSEVYSLQKLVGGKTIIDTTFHQFAHRSSQYVDYARKEVTSADVVIFSHPWVFPVVKDLLNRKHQIIIYDSQNVEGYLRYTLLNDGGTGTEIVRGVAQIESDLCHCADIILACSQEDKELFSRIYRVSNGKIRVVPNGVFVEQLKPVSYSEKQAIKKQLGLQEQTAAIFIGSNYSPNLEACEFITNVLAVQQPAITFIIAGGVGDGLNQKQLKGIDNIKVTGFLSEEKKKLYLAASDIAINPMFSGSGTNIKMFDYMASGLPIITTTIGARGIAETNNAGIVITDRSKFVSTINDMTFKDHQLLELGRANRKLVDQNYSWEKISPTLGSLLIKSITSKHQSAEVSDFPVSGKRIALMSSWGIKCGVAEHSRYLTDSFINDSIDVWIIANSNVDSASSHLIEDMLKNIHPLWAYDYKTWVNSKINHEGIICLLKQHAIAKLNIQYHIAFFSQSLLVDLVRKCVLAGVDVSVTFHNPKEVLKETIISLEKLNAKMIVHSKDAELQLAKEGIRNVHYIPLGILEFHDEDVDLTRKELGISGSPVIGSFGFLRKHKGVLEIIEAISILKEQFPNIHYIGLNSLYPSDDSIDYYKRCTDRIAELQLKQNITLITNFLQMDEIIHYLHAVDLVILPYHASKEGASASANTAISAKRPIIISESTIFDDIRQVGYEVKSILPEDIADQIQKVLSDPALIDQLKRNVTQHAEEYSYKKISRKYLEILYKEA